MHENVRDAVGKGKKILNTIFALFLFFIFAMNCWSGSVIRFCLLNAFLNRRVFYFHKFSYKNQPYNTDGKPVQNFHETASTSILIQGLILIPFCISQSILDSDMIAV